MRKCCLLLVVFSFIATASVAQTDLKPLSPEDHARVTQLLKAFDPASYDLRFQYAGTGGKAHTAKLGKAKGLLDLKQSGTIRGTEATAGTNVLVNVFKNSAKYAGTNVAINIFKQAAGTNVLINIFKQAAAAAGTNVAINIFKTNTQRANAEELARILNKYAE